MSGGTPDDKAVPAPSAAPSDGGTDGSRSGVGAQTALFAMLRKRSMHATRDPDTEPPGHDGSDPAAE